MSRTCRPLYVVLTVGAVVVVTLIILGVSLGVTLSGKSSSSSSTLVPRTATRTTATTRPTTHVTTARATTSYSNLQTTTTTVDTPSQSSPSSPSSTTSTTTKTTTTTRTTITNTDIYTTTKDATQTTQRTTTRSQAVYSGFANAGASSFAAACLQFLLASNFMNVSAQVTDWEAVRNQAPIAYALNAYNQLHTTGTPLDMNQIKQAFNSSMGDFSVDLFAKEQQGTSELLVWILDRLREEGAALHTNLFNNLQIMQHRVFVYTDRNEYRIENKTLTTVLLTFSGEIANKSTISLAELVEDNFKDRELDATDPTTEKTRFSASQFSPSLIFNIDYQRYNLATLSQDKLDIRVSLPAYVVVLNKYYALKSLVVKVTGAGEDNYVAYSMYDGKWWLFNNSQVTLMDVARVLNSATTPFLLYEMIDDAMVEEISAGIEPVELAMLEFNEAELLNLSPYVDYD